MADEKNTGQPSDERRNAARTRAENHFAASERRDSEVRKIGRASCRERVSNCV